MLRTVSLAMACAVATVAHAQDNTDVNKQILDMLQNIQQNQAGMLERIEKLEARGAAVAENSGGETPKETQSIAPSREAISRVNGWIASIHVSDQYGKVGGLLGRTIIDGFPMKHDVATKNEQSSTPIAYVGKGELKIEEEGTHSFSMYISIPSSGVSGSTCKFQMSIEGNEVLSGNVFVRDTYSWANSIDLVPGYYKWELTQHCAAYVSSYKHYTWDLRILTPSAFNAVSVGKNYIFYRE